MPGPGETPGFVYRPDGPNGLPEEDGLRVGGYERIPTTGIDSAHTFDGKHNTRDTLRTAKRLSPGTLPGINLPIEGQVVNEPKAEK